MDIEVYQQEVTFRMMPNESHPIRCLFQNGDVTQRVAIGTLQWDANSQDDAQSPPIFTPSEDGHLVMVNTYSLGVSVIDLHFYGTYSHCDVMVTLEVHEHLR